MLWMTSVMASGNKAARVAGSGLHIYVAISTRNYARMAARSSVPRDKLCLLVWVTRIPGPVNQLPQLFDVRELSHFTFPT